MRESGAGRSLWQDAWKRLKKNRFAMGGLVVVVVVSLLALTAPWIVSFQPDYGQPWLQAQPPGFTHPAVLQELRFDEGAAPVVPRFIPEAVAACLGEDGVLEYTVHEIAATEYRVRLRRGKVQRIQRLEGAERVDRIAVSGPKEYLRVLGEDGPVGPRFHDVALEGRAPVPDALATDGRILLVRVLRPRTPDPEVVRVVIDGGTVTELTRGGAPIDELRLDGRYVLETKKDGEAVVLKHWLGTDLQGRDVWSRVLYGGRISLMVGAVATLVSVLIGVVYGAFAGYLAQQPMTVWGLLGAVVSLAAAGVAFRLPDGFAASLLGAVAVVVAAGAAFRFAAPGVPLRVLHRPITTTGEFLMRIVDILYALPFMFLVILLMISYGQDILTLFVALGAVQWLMMARIVRGQVLSLKEKEFVEAARVCGASHGRIVFRHIIPNTLGVVIVYATLTVPAIILQESFLAFIGLTVESGGRTLDSWGSLVNQGRKALTSDGGNWWVLVVPSVAMALTLFSLNFLGDGLRDALDPKLRGRK